MNETDLKFDIHNKIVCDLFQNPVFFTAFLTTMKLLIQVLFFRINNWN